jgi:hypothetical protein
MRFAPEPAKQFDCQEDETRPPRPMDPHMATPAKCDQEPHFVNAGATMVNQQHTQIGFAADPALIAVAMQDGFPQPAEAFPRQPSAS